MPLAAWSEQGKSGAIKSRAAAAIFRLRKNLTLVRITGICHWFLFFFQVFFFKTTSPLLVSKGTYYYCFFSRWLRQLEAIEKV